jgi:hypothetical protein
MEFLGSDALQGRGTGTAGGAAAAQYIADKLEALALKPITPQGSYLQPIPMRGSFSLPGSRLMLSYEGETRTLRLIQDYLLYKTGAQTFVPNPVPLVFAGYGIVAPEFDYNDYQSLNVEGKVVVFLSGEPLSADPSYFGGHTETIHSYAEAKQRVAFSRGARGSILIPNPRLEACRRWSFWVNEFSFEHVTLAYSAAANLSILMHPAVAAGLFQGAHHSLDEVAKMDEESRIRSFPLRTKISFQGEFRQREFVSSNVVGMLEGIDPKLKDSYLIISSHYDHLGRGPAIRGDAIYNGVIDNASGVAAVLEIARVLKARESPRRSVIFLFTTGEEKGLLGSRYYIDHPLVPLYKTVANVNVDGTAFFDTFDDVVGVGAELSTLGELLQSYLEKRGLGFSTIPAQFSRTEGFTRSDQAAFAEAGIPSLLIMEGTHYRNTSPGRALRLLIEWGQKVYHSPFDDLSQPFNLEAALQHCNIILEYCSLLANSSASPEWHSGSPYIHARLQSIAEQR